MTDGVRSWVETADGLRLSVREWGRPDGPALLLIHGQAQCHLCFSPQIASALAEECRIVAFDMRGHGESDRPAGTAPYADADRFADDLARVIAATRLYRPVAVGWSMGGRVLRAYLVGHGDAALGGINFVGSRVIEAPELVSGRLGFWRAGEPPAMAAQIAATAAFLRECYRVQPSSDEFAATLAYNMLLSYEARAAIAGWTADPAAAQRAVAAVTVPVLVTHGARDAVAPPRASEMIVEALPAARLSWFEGCGHSPFQEAADRFNTELLAFVKSCHAP